jgi:photosystem II stability/assembly factor-like uncharacterized protein
LPAQGQSGHWVLAPGSDILDLCCAADGTLYAYADPASTDYRFFKSVDGGRKWSYCGYVKDEIVDIAVMPSDPSSVFYATATKIYYSDNGGLDFQALGAAPFGLGLNNLEISCIDVVATAEADYILIGTRDSDAGQFGGVYLQRSNSFSGWSDTGLSGYDILTVAFSPHYAADRQILAVATDETDSFVFNDLNQQGWGSLIGAAVLTGRAAVSACLAFPPDYSSDLYGPQNRVYLGLNCASGTGDVFRIESTLAPDYSQAVDLNAGAVIQQADIDIYSLAANWLDGLLFLAAGSADGSGVFSSTNGGQSWSPAAKPPTGDTGFLVRLPPGFSDSQSLYCASGGVESAFSVSHDLGQSWDQISLIDSELTDLIDMALSPDYSRDNTLFLLTNDVKDSLWRTRDGGVSWARIYSATLDVNANFNRLLTASAGGSNLQVFIAGSSSGTPAVWESSDSGRQFSLSWSCDTQNSSPVAIDAWAVTDEGLLVGSFDGTNGVVYKRLFGTAFYASKIVLGSQPIHSLAVAGGQKNAPVLAGGISGAVYYAPDGVHFDALPPDSAPAPFSGAVQVAFHPAFAGNHTVLAVSDAADEGIACYNLDNGFLWETQNSGLPEGMRLSDICLTPEGTIYVADRQILDFDTVEGGVFRCLSTNAKAAPSFEPVMSGLTDGSAITRLQLSNQTLWAFESTSDCLMVMTDSLVSAVRLLSPEDSDVGQDPLKVKISWQALAGAELYQWQVDLQPDFSTVASGCAGETAALSARLPVLEPDNRYYWRVRVSSPVESPWSEIRSFDTRLASQSGGPQIVSPDSNVPVSLNPVLQWSVVSGAQGYELLIARDEAFLDIVVAKSGDNLCLQNAWRCETALEYNTAYYWKVRAVDGANSSAWSGSGLFVTVATPESSPEEQEPSTGSLAAQDNIVYAPVSIPPIIINMPSLPADDGSDDTVRWLYFALGSLTVLTIGLIVAVVLILKRLRRF